MKNLLFGKYKTIDEAVEGLKKKIKEEIKNPHRIPFRQHIPAFVDGVTPEQYVATSFEDLPEKNKNKLSENKVARTIRNISKRRILETARVSGARKIRIK